MKLIKKLSPYLLIIGIIVLAIFLVTSFIDPPEMSYTEFVRELESGNVKSVELEDYTATIEIEQGYSGKINLDVSALNNYFGMEKTMQAQKVLEFNSSKKYSAVEFDNGKTYETNRQKESSTRKGEKITGTRKTATSKGRGAPI